MPAPKKSTTKATKSPAPATKAPAKPAPKAAVTPKPAPAKPAAKSIAKKKPVAPAPAAARAPEPAPVAPTVKAVATKPVSTTISAKIDIGFGNALFIRGEGPGLSWDLGVQMTCVADDCWEIVLGEAARPFTFKFLVNDLSWSEGADYVLSSGESVVLAPTFE